jgi:hypothetical protein
MIVYWISDNHTWTNFLDTYQSSGAKFTSFVLKNTPRNCRVIFLMRKMSAQGQRLFSKFVDNIEWRKNWKHSLILWFGLNFEFRKFGIRQWRSQTPGMGKKKKVLMPKILKNSTSYINFPQNLKWIKESQQWKFREKRQT